MVTKHIAVRNNQKRITHVCLKSVYFPGGVEEEFGYEPLAKGYYLAVFPERISWDGDTPEKVAYADVLDFGWLKEADEPSPEAEAEADFAVRYVAPLMIVKMLEMLDLELDEDLTFDSASEDGAGTDF